MIATMVVEFERSRQVRPKKLVAAIITGLKDQLRTIGWLGISCDAVFSATPLLEAVRFLMSLMMTETRQAASYKLTFIDIISALFHSPSRRGVFVESLSRTGMFRLAWTSTQARFF